jgi:hypothetical protein
VFIWEEFNLLCQFFHPELYQGKTGAQFPRPAASCEESPQIQIIEEGTSREMCPLYFFSASFSQRKGNPHIGDNEGMVAFTLACET